MLDVLDEVMDLQAFCRAMRERVAEAAAEPERTPLIHAALARQEARPVKRIDYDRMREVSPKQKRALTAAVKTKDAEKVAAVCKAAVAEWNEIGAWPDNWSMWQRALSDLLPWHMDVDIADL